MMQARTRPGWAAVVLGAYGVGLAASAAALVDLVRAPLAALATPAPPTLETLVEGACAVALVGCSAWLACVTALALAAQLTSQLAPGSRPARTLVRTAERRCPATVRRLLATALGVALGGLVVAPALARPGADGLALPDRTTGAVARPSVTGEVEVVRPGDSLWAITERLLGGHPTDAEVAHGWHRLHRANLDRVGDDPDLIHPGTRLVVPDLHRKDRP